MPQVKPDVESFARIKVVGCGGSGKNAINHMIEAKVKGVEFIAVNTDAQDLHNTEAKKKIHIGKNVTKGLGAGMDPEVGRRAAEETREELQEALKGSDMIFLAGGMGGGTFTGASTVIAQIAKDMNALTVAVTTKPFFFEGNQRMSIAERGLEELRHSVDAIIVIPNDRLLQTIDKDTTANDAFAYCDEVLRQAVEGISDLITTPGVINIDFADIKAIMEGAGSALMGIGIASGDNRAVEAAKQAINSPLLELSISGAKGVLFSIAGGDDLKMHEIQEAAKIITESVDSTAKIIFGTINDTKLKKNDLKVTVIATGFPEDEVKRTLFGGSLIQSQTTSEESTQTEDTPEKSSGIFSFNSSKKEEKESPMPKMEDLSAQAGKAPKKSDKKAKVKEDEIDDDDDWGAVPAFLRRSKLK